MHCPRLRELPPPPKGKKGWPWTVESKPFPGRKPGGHVWPCITIVTPSLNQAHFLEQTIRSILLQGYPDLEYILRDGGSSDDSTKIIRKYETFLAYWISEPDSGHGNALNKGFSRSSGEIMAWLNSDDMYAPAAFTTVAKIFDRFKEICWIEGIQSGWDKHDRKQMKLRRLLNIYDFLADDECHWIQQESTFWRRALWEKAGSGINEKYKFMVDLELWLRFFLLTELWHVDAIVGGYRLHDSNRTTLHMDTVLKERNMAIAEARGACPRDILEIAGVIRNLKKINRPYLKKLMGKLLNKICDDIHYKKVICKRSTWRKAASEFQL
jgi:glycosyltransferase involved in cell wall biosynthesis